MPSVKHDADFIRQRINVEHHVLADALEALLVGLAVEDISWGQVGHQREGNSVLGMGSTASSQIEDQLVEHYTADLIVFFLEVETLFEHDWV